MKCFTWTTAIWLDLCFVLLDHGTDVIKYDSLDLSSVGKKGSLSNKEKVYDLKRWVRWKWIIKSQDLLLPMKKSTALRESFNSNQAQSSTSHIQSEFISRSRAPGCCDKKVLHASGCRLRKRSRNSGINQWRKVALPLSAACLPIRKKRDVPMSKLRRESLLSRSGGVDQIGSRSRAVSLLR